MPTLNAIENVLEQALADYIFAYTGTTSGTATDRLDPEFRIKEAITGSGLLSDEKGTLVKVVVQSRTQDEQQIGTGPGSVNGHSTLNVLIAGMTKLYPSMSEASQARNELSNTVEKLILKGDYGNISTGTPETIYEHIVMVKQGEKTDPGFDKPSGTQYRAWFQHNWQFVCQTFSHQS